MLSSAITRDLRYYLVLGLLFIYSFTVPLGNLARFGPDEGAYGVSTLVLLVLVILTLPTSLKVIFKEPILLWFGILIVWILLASAFATDQKTAFINGGALAFYLATAAAAYFYLRDELVIRRLLAVYCFAGLISAGVTIIDLIGVVDIPNVNEAIKGTITDSGYLMQATGPFPRRTAMAVYFTFVIVVGLLVPLVYRRDGILLNLFFLISATVCLLALMLTHNRAGVLSSLIAVFVVLIGSLRTPVRLIKIATVVSVILASFTVAVNVWFPELWRVYSELLGIGIVSTKEESDATRILFAQHIFLSLEANPIGNGYSLVPGVRGFEAEPVDPHNNLSQIIWSAGVFGLAWLIYFIGKAIVRGGLFFRSPRSDSSIGRLLLVVIGALLAFMLTGMTHTIISTGFAWILFGLFLGTYRLQKHVTLRATN